MPKFWNEFQEFAMKGSVVDLAVGVIIGGAFGKIINSFVSDLLMPPFGAVLQGIDFKELKIILTIKADGMPGAVWSYGNFLQVCVEFLFISLAIFAMVKIVNTVRRSHSLPAGPTNTLPSEEEKLLRDIRDILQKNYGEEHRRDNHPTRSRAGAEPSTKT